MNVNKSRAKIAAFLRDLAELLDPFQIDQLTTQAKRHNIALKLGLLTADEIKQLRYK